MLEDVPVLSPKVHNESRRFITFVDIIYENDVLLAMQAAVPLPELFQAEEIFESKAPDLGSIQVLDKGGSSGRLTTYMGDGTVEWSATGLKDASLAGISAIRDVNFAFQRAYSRLVEMQSTKYRQRHDRQRQRREQETVTRPRE